MLFSVSVRVNCEWEREGGREGGRERSTCESWCHERALTHCSSSQGWASGVLLFCVCCVCDFDVCIWVFVWGGVSETSFLLFLHLFFTGVLAMHMCFTCVLCFHVENTSCINVTSLPVLLCVSRPHSSSRNGTAVDLSTQTLPSTTSHRSTSCLDPAVKRVIFIRLECSAMLCTMEVDHCVVVSTTYCLLNRMWKL